MGLELPRGELGLLAAHYFTMHPVPGARREIDRQRRLDECYVLDGDVLIARIRALAGAKRSLAADRPDAFYELRQALVDLAACAERFAETLPAPSRKRTTLR